MLQTPLSKFLGRSPYHVRRNYKSRSRNFEVTDAVESTNVPLLIQQNRIRNEQNPRRRESLRRQYDELEHVSAPLPVQIHTFYITHLYLHVLLCLMYSCSIISSTSALESWNILTLGWFACSSCTSGDRPNQHFYILFFPLSDHTCLCE